MASKQETRFFPYIFIVSGPSGVGKTTLVHSAIETLPNLRISVSYTTRAKRPSEQEAVDYHFVSRNVFEAMREKDLFLENAEILGEYYGTSRTIVEGAYQQGSDIILTIDWQGAKQIKDKYKDVITIFILPPSIDGLLERLNRRHQDSEMVIQKRMEKAKEVIIHCKEYDYLIINDKLENAILDLKSIIHAHRLNTKRQSYVHQELILVCTEYPKIKSRL